MAERVFVDSSVLIRYLVDDDVPRAIAANDLMEREITVVISTGVLLETVHAVRTGFGIANPALGMVLIDFLSRDNVELADASAADVIRGLRWSIAHSARRIPDTIIAAAAARAGCDWIATFDEGFRSPGVPSRLL